LTKFLCSTEQKASSITKNIQSNHNYNSLKVYTSIQKNSSYKNKHLILENSPVIRKPSSYNQNFKSLHLHSNRTNDSAKKKLDRSSFIMGDESKKIHSRNSLVQKLKKKKKSFTPRFEEIKSLLGNTMKYSYMKRNDNSQISSLQNKSNMISSNNMSRITKTHKRKP